MTFKDFRDVHIRIRRPVLDAVFDECDRYDDAETGGKLLGTVAGGASLGIDVSAVIDAGPKAKRTRTSLFQDGRHQQRVFRTIERAHPEIEHLGTWHTHHVNGYPHLSSGDLETYFRTVNHPKHNTDFFYALLVVARTGNPQRYSVLHYLLRRGDPDVYQIPDACVEIVSEPSVWVPPGRGLPDSAPGCDQRHSTKRPQGAQGGLNLDLALDNRALQLMYPDLQSFQSRSTGILYWRGTVPVGGDLAVGVLIAPAAGEQATGYVAAVAGQSKEVVGALETRHERPWMAALSLERSVAENRIRRALHEGGASSGSSSGTARREPGSGRLAPEE